MQAFATGVVAAAYAVAVMPFCRLHAEVTDGEGAELAKSLVVAAVNERLECPEFHVSCRLSVDGSAPIDCYFLQKQGMRKTTYRSSLPDDEVGFSGISLDGKFAWVINGDNGLARMSYDTGRRRGHTTECYDLRAVGLTGVISGADDAFSAEWLLMNTTAFQTVAVETVDGEEVQRIKLVGDGISREFSISLNDFRVHGVKGAGPYVNYEVKSYYDAVRPPAFRWLPSKVISTHQEGVDYVFSDIVLLDDMLPDSEFEFQSLELPIGATVDDYDAKQRIGYWNGESIVKDYPYAAVQAAKIRNPQQSPRLPLTVGLGMLAVFVVGILYFSKRKRSTALTH